MKLFERDSTGINPEEAPLHHPNVQSRHIRQADPLPGGGRETGDAVAPETQQLAAGLVSRARPGSKR